MAEAKLAQAALALVDCPFRLHGRDPATGLDCVGLVAASLAAVGVQPIVPSGYGLRNLEIDHWLPLAHRSGLIPATGAVRGGDILLIALARSQHHLAIACDPTDAVHAHVGLRQVVRQPRDPAWQISARWRLSPIRKG